MPRIVRGLVILVVALLSGVNLLAQKAQSSFLTINISDRYRLSLLSWTAGDPLPHSSASGPVLVLFGTNVTVRNTNGQPELHEAGDVIYLEDGVLDHLGTPGERPLRAYIMELQPSARTGAIRRQSVPTAFPRTGATTVLDNEHVTVWSYTLRPEDRDQRHYHAMPHVTLWLDDGTIQQGPPGLADSPVQAGEIQFGGVVIDMEHAADRAIRAVTVEVK